MCSIADRAAAHRAFMNRHLLYGRSPVPRWAFAEPRFQRTAWIERKPGAMWDEVPGTPAIVVR